MPTGVSPSSVGLVVVRGDQQLFALEINEQVPSEYNVLKTLKIGSKGQCVSYAVCLVHSRGWKGLEALTKEANIHRYPQNIDRTFQETPTRFPRRLLTLARSRTACGCRSVTDSLPFQNSRHNHTPRAAHARGPIDSCIPGATPLGVLQSCLITVA